MVYLLVGLRRRLLLCPSHLCHGLFLLREQFAICLKTTRQDMLKCCNNKTCTHLCVVSRLAQTKCKPCKHLARCSAKSRFLMLIANLVARQTAHGYSFSDQQKADAAAQRWCAYLKQQYTSQPDALKVNENLGRTLNFGQRSHDCTNSLARPSARVQISRTSSRLMNAC